MMPILIRFYISAILAPQNWLSLRTLSVCPRTLCRGVMISDRCLARNGLNMVAIVVKKSYPPNQYLLTPQNLVIAFQWCESFGMAIFYFYGKRLFCVKKLTKRVNFRGQYNFNVLVHIIMCPTNLMITLYWQVFLKCCGLQLSDNTVKKATTK